MDNTEIVLVRAGFAKIAPIADGAAALFYERLFSLDPTLRALFKGDMKAQGAKLMAVLANAVNHLDRLDAILPAVRDLGRRHSAYGVKDEHYDTVGAALLSTLESALGEGFTIEARAAWAAAYGALAGEMKSAAANAAVA
jgi:hemoglobin-like flavoprotein